MIRAPGFEKRSQCYTRNDDLQKEFIFAHQKEFLLEEIGS